MSYKSVKQILNEVLEVPPNYDLMPIKEAVFTLLDKEGVPVETINKVINLLLSRGI